MSFELAIDVYEGWLYKLTWSPLSRSWKRRYFVLRHQELLYYKSPVSQNVKLGPYPCKVYRMLTVLGKLGRMIENRQVLWTLSIITVCESMKRGEHLSRFEYNQLAGTT